MAQSNTTTSKTKTAENATKDIFGQFTYNPEFVEQFAQANEKVVESTLEAANITIDALKQISRKQVEFAGAMFELGNRQFELMSATKDPAALGGLQSQLGEAVLAQWTNYLNALPKIGVEASKRYGKVVNDTVATSTKAAA